MKTHFPLQFFNQTKIGTQTTHNTDNIFKKILIITVAPLCFSTAFATQITENTELILSEKQYYTGTAATELCPKAFRNQNSNVVKNILSNTEFLYQPGATIDYYFHNCVMFNPVAFDFSLNRIPIIPQNNKIKQDLHNRFLR